MECPSPVVYGMPHEMTEETLLEVDGVSKWDKQSKILRMFRREGGLRMVRDTIKAGWTLGRPLHR